MPSAELTDKEALQQAAVLIAYGWSKGAHARSLSGTVVALTSPQAHSWDLLGALLATLGLYEYQGQPVMADNRRQYNRLLALLRIECDCEELDTDFATLLSFNDKSTQQQVLSLLHRTASKL